MARGVGGQTICSRQRKANGAPKEIVDILKNLSSRPFGGPQDVMKSYGDERQEQR